MLSDLVKRINDFYSQLTATLSVKFLGNFVQKIKIRNNNFQSLKVCLPTICLPRHFIEQIIKLSGEFLPI